MTYLNEQLVEQRVSQLRQAAAQSRRAEAVSRGTRHRPVRTAVGHLLVRWGERLAPVAGSVATR